MLYDTVAASPYTPVRSGLFSTHVEVDPSPRTSACPENTMPEHALLTRYRDGEHTAQTRAAHATSVRDWRRDLTDAEIDLGLRAELLARVRTAGVVVEPAAELG